MGLGRGVIQEGGGLEGVGADTSGGRVLLNVQGLHDLTDRVGGLAHRLLLHVDLLEGRGRGVVFLIAVVLVLEVGGVLVPPLFLH